MINPQKIEEIREIIGSKCLNHILDCEVNDIIQYLVIQSFTGSGKSVTAMKMIDEAGYTWMYFAPFHDIIKENLEYSKLRNYEFVHLKGKKQKGICLSKEYRAFAKQGITITPFCETRCPYRHNGCTYYETRDLIESYPHSWAGVHSHIPTYLQSFLYDVEYKGKKMFNYYDVIIIDEFPFQVLFNQELIEKGDIDHLRNVISYMRIDSDEKWFIGQVLNELSLSTDHIDINYKRINYLIQDNRGLKIRKFLEEYNKTLLTLISQKTIRSPPKNILFNLGLIYQDNPDKDKLKWNFYRHKFDGWSRPGIYITTSNINYFKNLPIPIIALDATAEIKAWNTLLNDKCFHTKIDMEYKNLYQLRSNGRYPVSTWITIEDNKKVLSKTGIKLCDLIIRICKRKKNTVLICSNKRIKEKIQDYLKKNYRKKNYTFAIYYNLRSRNSFYEKCDTCIISHEPNIPPLQLEIMENVIGWNTELLNELMTNSEIKQAIGRIRQNIYYTPDGRKRKEIEVFLFPGAYRDEEKVLNEAKLISYENLYVGELYTVREILIEIFIKARELNLTTIREYTKDLCSYNILKSEIKKLYVDGYVSDFRGVIKWIYNEEEAKRINYKVKL